MIYERSAGISFRGFDGVDAMVAALGITPSLIGRKGELAKQGVKATLRRNVVSYYQPIPHEVRWSEAVEGVIQLLGGLEKLQDIVAEFKPEFVHFDLVLPVRSSGEQEDNYIESEVMAKLVSLNASFGCSFV